MTLVCFSQVLEKGYDYVRRHCICIYILAVICATSNHFYSMPSAIVGNNDTALLAFSLYGLRIGPRDV